jgi:hypothetical protein
MHHDLSRPHIAHHICILHPTLPTLKPGNCLNTVNCSNIKFHASRITIHYCQMSIYLETLSYVFYL